MSSSLWRAREKIDPKTAFDHDDVDKSIKPVAGEKWKAFKGKCDSIERNQSIDLNRVFKDHENSIAHACVYVHSETDCKVQLWVYGDDGLQVVVNGQPVYTEPKSFQKKEIKEVELKRGWNTMLMGITQTYGFWGFRVIPSSKRALQGASNSRRQGLFASHQISNCCHGSAKSWPEPSSSARDIRSSAKSCRTGCWASKTKNTSSAKLNLREFRWIQSPRGHFYADPFVIEHEGKPWVFFEDLPYSTNKGIIVCAEVRY